MYGRPSRYHFEAAGLFPTTHKEERKGKMAFQKIKEKIKINCAILKLT